MKNCRALKSKCSNCQKIGHCAKVCHQKTVIKTVTDDEADGDGDDGVYHLNIWRIQSQEGVPKYTHKDDFKFR